MFRLRTILTVAYHISLLNFIAEIEAEIFPIRLFGGNSSYGRLQIQNRTWNTICDDDWTEINTFLACKELGFMGGMKSRNFQRIKAGSDAPINGQGFNCQLDVKNISLCDDNGYSTTECYHNEDVFLRCFTTCSSNENKFKCANGNCINKTLKCDSKDDCFDNSDELSCPCSKGMFTCDNGKCIPMNNTCNFVNDCGDHSDESCFNHSLALYSTNNDKNQGLLLMNINGSWGTVCGTNWTAINSRIACRELGYESGDNFLYPLSSTKPIMSYIAREIDCSKTPNATKLADCPRDNSPVSCSSYINAIQLKCFEKGVSWNVRLVGGDESNGRLQVQIDGNWTTVCGDGWSDINSRIVCKTLGFDNGLKIDNVNNTLVGQDVPIGLDGVFCSEGDPNLYYCLHSPAYQQNCGHYDDVFLQCYNGCYLGMFKCKNGMCIDSNNKCNFQNDCGDNSDEDGCYNGTVYLYSTDGNKNVGQLFVKFNGTYRTVCNNNWSSINSEVTCIEMGYSLGWNISFTTYDTIINKPFSLSNFNCSATPNATKLMECINHDLSSNMPCSSFNTIKLACFSKRSDWKARLVGGDVSSGRLQVNANGNWITVCDDGWTNINSRVACLSLGFQNGLLISNVNNTKEGQDVPIGLDNVICPDGVPDLFYCSHPSLYQHNCGHNEDVFLQCYNSCSYKLNQYQCTNGQCIDSNKRCDHNYDCDDMSDESNCGCYSGMFQCKNGMCLSLTSKCNFINNCGDNSDEEGCYNGTIALYSSNGVNNDGQLVVKINGTWASVCSKNWSSINSQVACRDLGYDLGQLRPFSYYDYILQTQLMLSDVDCSSNPNTTKLLDCSYNQSSYSYCSSINQSPYSYYNVVRLACFFKNMSLNVRLVGGDSSSGRLQVQINGNWTTVCDDGWTSVNSRIVCMMLGFKDGRLISNVNNTIVGQDVPIGLDDVTCSEGDINLMFCSHLPFYQHNCGHSEDVFLQCYNDCSNFNLYQCANGQCIDSYRRCNYNYDCMDRSDELNCTCYSNQFQCKNGNCLSLNSKCNFQNDCGDNSDEEGCYNGTIALYSSNGVNNDGQLMVKINGTWASVCSKNWSSINSQVACRELGYDIGRYRPFMYYDYILQTQVMLNDVDCSSNPNATKLLDCSYNQSSYSYCSTYDAIRLTCFKKDMSLNVRLVGGDRSSGRLQVQINGNWSTVCDDGWTSVNSRIVCMMLGFKDGRLISNVNNTIVGQDVPIGLDDVTCSEGDTNLMFCSHLPFYQHNCGHGEDVFLQCYNDCSNFNLYQCANGQCIDSYRRCNYNYDCMDRSDELNCTCYSNQFQCKNGNCLSLNSKCNFLNDCGDNSDEDGCYNGTIALYSSNGVNNDGQLMVKINGTWASVCNKNWSSINSQVACRELGYDIGRYRPFMYYDYILQTQVMLNDVDCSSNPNATKLLDCSYNQSSYSYCSTYDAIRLTCFKKDMSLNVRLVGGDRSSGRLQVQINGNWSTVCDDGWTSVNSRIVCKMLGFKDGRLISNVNNTIVGQDVPIGLDDVTCSEGDTDLMFCSHPPFYQHNCGHSEDVFLQCFSACNELPNSFLCNNSQCISTSLRCNMNNDCLDGSDEVNCPCNETYKFKCTNGKCIYSYNVCDNWNNCGDNSDELNCTCNVSTGKFQCSNGPCIYSYYRCDNYDNCGDGSDEIGCPCTSINQFRCSNGLCILKSKRCNAVKDCQDGSDEINCPCDKPYQFNCLNGNCINRYLQCDFNDDCGDGSDEDECSKCVGFRDYKLFNYCVNTSFIYQTWQLRLPSFISQSYLNPVSTTVPPAVYYDVVCRNKAVFLNCIESHNGLCDAPGNNNYLLNSKHINLTCNQWEEYKTLEWCLTNAPDPQHMHSFYFYNCLSQLMQQYTLPYDTNHLTCSDYNMAVNYIGCYAYSMNKTNPECGSFEYLFDALYRLDYNIPSYLCQVNNDPICNLSVPLLKTTCNPAPKFSNVKLLGPIVKNRTSIEFDCQFTSDEVNPNAQFYITFLFDGSSAMDVPTFMVNGVTRKTTLHEKYLVGKLGQSISCEIESAWSNSSNVRSTRKRSTQPYFMGVTASKQKISIFENQSLAVEVEYSSTIPITCTLSSSSSDQCIIPFKLITGKYVRIKNDSQTTCSRSFQEETRLSTKFYVYPTMDIFNVGFVLTGIWAKTAVLPLKSYNGSTYKNIWSNYIFPIITVAKYDQMYPAAACSITGYSRIDTFDNMYYSINQFGQFLYVKSSDANFEVQARHFPCLSTIPCLCSIAIREGDFILIVDMCTNLIPRYLAYPSTSLPSGYYTQRSSIGDSFELSTPSGKIYGSISKNMLSAVIYVNPFYRSTLTGLCGNYDGLPSNDLQYKNKTTVAIINNYAPENYVNQWNLAKGQSLFDGYIDKVTQTPSVSLPAYKEKVCSCSTSLDSCNVETNPAGIVKGSFLIDVRRLNLSNPTRNEKNQSIYDDTSISFINYNAGLNKLGLTWPTLSGITESQANVFCMNSIENNDILKELCNDVIGSQKLAQIIGKCVQDIQVSGVFNSVIDKQHEFATVCQLNIASRITSLSPTTDQSLTANTSSLINNEESALIQLKIDELETFQNILCGLKCHAIHGMCIEGVCTCSPGYTSFDCSLPVNAVPSINGFRSNQLCDIRAGCGYGMYLSTSNTSSTPNAILCQYNVKYKNTPNNTFDQYGVYQTIGSYENEILTLCPQPDSVKTGFIDKSNASQKTAFLTLPRGNPVLKVLLKLGNGLNSLTSNEVTYYIYDSICYNCSGSVCVVKSDACVINGYCFKKMDANPDDNSKICDPAQSVTSWSTKIDISGSLSNFVLNEQVLMFTMTIWLVIYTRDLE